jgi:polyisoprenoid-binding protein YceI
MFSRFVPILLSLIILGIVLTGCGAATEQTPAQQPASQAAAPTNTPAPAVTATAAPATQAPTLAAPPATQEAAPATSEATVEPPAAEASTDPRTFQIIPQQSEATYQVQEEFFNRPVNLVSPIGRTNAIEGQFQFSLAGNQIQLADNQFKVDLRTLTSDEARRDQRIRSDWLEADKYPWAEFKATTIENFPANVTEGQDVSFKLTGDMTIREITKPQTFEVTARLDGNTFTGTATGYLLMKDYGFEPPSILGMLKVTDGVTVTVKFAATEVKTGS